MIIVVIYGGFSLKAVNSDLVGPQKIYPSKRQFLRGGGVILKLAALKENPIIDHLIL